MKMISLFRDALTVGTNSAINLVCKIVLDPID